MKIDPNYPAFPAVMGDARYSGVSVREYFIAAALQGILAGKPNISYAVAVLDAVRVADDVILRLNTEQ